MSCPITYCPNQFCGDRLIHQGHRGKDESTSAFGQFCHDAVTGRTSFSDVDLQMISGDPAEMLESQIQQLHFTFGDIQRLRVFEHKWPGGALSTAQRWILPIWRRLIYLGIQDRHVSTASGVYVVEGEPPWDTLLVTKHLEQHADSPERQKFDRDAFLAWMGGAK
jgi:hypothetical protein